MAILGGVVVAVVAMGSGFVMVVMIVLMMFVVIIMIMMTGAVPVTRMSIFDGLLCVLFSGNECDSVSQPAYLAFYFCLNGVVPFVTHGHCAGRDGHYDVFNTVDAPDGRVDLAGTGCAVHSFDTKAAAVSW
jgi:hypothetical protein